MSFNCRRLTPVVIPLVLACLSSQTSAADAPPGTKWRLVTSMTGMGMNLPERTTEVCSNGDADHPEPPKQSGNSDCSYHETSRSGNTIKYSMSCTGKEKMTGTGEMVYSADHYSGKFDITTDHGPMSMTYEGTRLGACTGTEANSSAAKERVQQMQNQYQQQLAASQQAMTQGCGIQAENAASPYPFMDAFKTGTVQCADPAMKRSYCEHFQTYKPFLAQEDTQKGMAGSGAGNPMGTPFSDSLKLCGLDADTVRDRLCATAEKDDAWDYLTKECPSQMKTIAARECTGRSYTTVNVKYRNLCATYATNSSGTAGGSSGNTAQQPADAAKDGLKDKAKNALKGLFGH